MATAAQTHEGGTMMPSIVASSLQAINCKFQYIIECIEGHITLLYSKRVTDLDPPVDPTDAANKAYVDAHSSSPGGTDTDVQYNNAGALGGSPNFTWNNGTNTLTVLGTITGINAPAAPSDATNKNYVDSLVVGHNPAAPIGSIQFNAGSNTFGGSPNLMWTTSTNTLMISGNENVSGYGIFTSTVQSINPFTGALVVAGGVGIGKDLNIAGNAYANRFIATSDATLKENIQLLGNPLDKLRKVECYSYNLKDNSEYTWNAGPGDQSKNAFKKVFNKTEYGFVAQQLEEVGLSDFVDNTRKYKGVNYLQFITILAGSIKDLDKRVTEYSLRNQNLDQKKVELDLSESLDCIKTKKVLEINKDISNGLSKLIKETMTNVSNDIKTFYEEFTDEISEDFKAINDDSAEMFNRLDTLCETINKFQSRVDTINNRLDEVEEKLENVQNSVDTVFNKLFEKVSREIDLKIKEYETTIIQNYNDTCDKKMRRKMSRKFK